MFGETLAEALRCGRLKKLEEVIQVAVLTDLLDQANDLIIQGRYLPACVILRAVLEERLRKLCEKHGCMPPKPKPTINNFNLALVAADVFNKTTQKQVDWMTAIGNDAAHNKRPIEQKDAELLYPAVLAFLREFAE